MKQAKLAHDHFNPRSPHGERPYGALKYVIEHKIFQSTLPARGATIPEAHERRIKNISIHAPRTGSDYSINIRCLYRGISIHAPRTGSDGLEKLV